VTSNRRRIGHVDALRGIAVTGMVGGHWLMWALDPAQHATAWFAWVQFLLKPVAVAFLLLVGVSLVMRAQAAGTGALAFGAALRRGAKLVVLGFAVNLMIVPGTGDWVDLLSWDVLQTIGVAVFLTAPLALRLPPLLLLSLGLVFVLVDPFIGAPGGSYAAAVLHSSLERWPVSFPMVPWLAFPLIGCAFGRWWVAADAEAKRTGLAAALLLLGVVAAAAGWVADGDPLAYDPADVSAGAFTHPPVGRLVLALGIFTALWAVLQLGYEAGLRLAPLETLGRHALVLYVLHLVVVPPLWWLGYAGSLGTAATLAWMAALLAGLYTLARWCSAWLRRLRQLLV
jgi:uncharacterized membrane protein